MASPARPVMALARARPALLNGIAAPKAFSTVCRAAPIRAAARPSVVAKLNASGRSAFRRGYADEAAPKKKSGAIRTTFRWLWRLSYLSVGGLIGYTCWVIYEDRNPLPQHEPDPNKKTLVILGES